MCQFWMFHLQLVNFCSQFHKPVEITIIMNRREISAKQMKMKIFPVWSCIFTEG